MEAIIHVSEDELMAERLEENIRRADEVREFVLAEIAPELDMFSDADELDEVRVANAW